MHPIFGNVPTLHDVDPVDRRRCGRKAGVEGRRRFRCAPRQLAALRLAVIRRLHGQRPGSDARRFAARRGADTGDHAQRNASRLHPGGAAASTTTARSRSASRTKSNKKVRGPDLDDYAVIDQPAAGTSASSRLGGVYERLEVRHADGRPEARLLGRQRHDPDGSGRAGTLFYGRRRRRQGRRGGRRRVSASGRRVRTRLATSGKSATRMRCRSARRSTRATCKIDNDSNANYKFNINPYPIAIGGNASGLVMGMIHLF